MLLSFTMAGNKMHVASYRAKLKQDPEKWAQYLEKQNATARKYRADKCANMNAEETEAKRKYERERKQQQRAGKQKLVVKLPTQGIIFRLTVCF